MVMATTKARFGFPLEYVSDIDTAKRFFVDVLGLELEDADAAFKEMSRQARVSMPPRQMPFGRCFGIEDPAGQVHYLLEFAAERPSQQIS